MLHPQRLDFSVTLCESRSTAASDLILPYIVSVGADLLERNVGLLEGGKAAGCLDAIPSV